MLIDEYQLFLLDTFKKNIENYPGNKTIVDLFEEQVNKSPDSLAVVCQETKLTYRELNEKANQLAHFLIHQYDVKPDNLVGIELERNEWMIIGLLAILKSGGSFLPIDTDYPHKRKNYIKSDSEIVTCIDTFFISEFHDICQNLPKNNPLVGVKPENLAYSTYTSGSTGLPKGVLIEHRQLCSFIVSNKNTFFHHIAEGEKPHWFSVTKYTFDISFFEIFGSLTYGFTLNLSLVGNVDYLLDIISDNPAGVLQITPAYFEELISNESAKNLLPKLSTLLIGGDTMGHRVFSFIKKYLNEVKVFNVYGPTETTIWSSCLSINGIDEISIGTALPGEVLFILDSDFKPVKEGEIGEIYVGGAGVARGYLNRPELTADRFVKVSEKEDLRLYRTGDLGRILPDGNVAFLGRIDDQIKLRGYRIELGEIANAIGSFEAVKQVIVIGRNIAGKEEPELAAYYTGDATGLELNNHIRQFLPDYMVPAFFVKMNQLPLNSSGKIDKKALPDPESAVLQHIAYTPPKNEIEDRILKIWSQILGINADILGVTAEFFSVGGQSIKAIRIISQIQKEIGVKLTLKDFFKNNTVELLAGFIGGDNADSAYMPIPSSSVGDTYPLSASQKRLWVLSQFDDALEAYLMPYVLKLNCEIDESAFETTYREMLVRHPALRSVFATDDSANPIQKVKDEHDPIFTFHYKDFSLLPEAERGIRISEAISSIATREIKISEGPLFSCSLIKESNQHYWWIITVHHLIGDGWSMDVFFEEFGDLYYSGIHNKKPKIEASTIQYADFTLWYNELLQTDAVKTHKDFWINKFNDNVPVLEIPNDTPRPQKTTYRGDNYYHEIDKSVSEKLRLFTKEVSGTTFLTVQTALILLLHKYSGLEDIIIGTPVAGRIHPDLDRLIGFFVNTVPIRSKFNKCDTVEELYQNIKNETLDAYQHQMYPYDRLIEDLRLKRDIGRNPLFDIMLLVQSKQDNNNPFSTFLDSKHPYSRLNGQGLRSARFDLTFEYVEGEKSDYLAVNYKTDIYSENKIRCLCEYLEVILSKLPSCRETKIKDIEIVDQDEKIQILKTIDENVAHFSSEKTIVDLFVEQVKRTPEATAVKFRNIELTYAELNRQANRLANYLIQYYQVKPDDLIGIELERSEKMIIAVWGILKSGAAYTPIDPHYPEPRKSFIVNDAGLKLVITEKVIMDFYELQTKNPFSEDEPSTSLHSRNLAYVIYTSGSTGTPKGCLLEHRGLVNRLEWMQKSYPLSAKDCILQKTTFTFDVSVWELIWWALNGASVCMLEPEGEKLPEKIIEEIRNHGVTVMHFVPSMFSVFLEHLAHNNEDLASLSGLKQIYASGEALQVSHVRKFFSLLPWVKLMNLYGPTEASIDVSFYNCEHEDVQSIPIGRPIDNISLYLLDTETQNFVPYGGIGEICIGGVGLARGYLNRPELTSEKFIQNPYKKGDRLYRTGDLGRWRQDGNLEYLGRIDDQVKIRGHRIELGEIELALSGHPKVEQVIVLARSLHDSADNELIAYTTGEASATELKTFLKERLPNYMVPNYYVNVDMFPLTSNGKLNKKELPLPTETGTDSSVYIAPTTKIHKTLARIWSEVLRCNIDNIGLNSDFFELGGDSIKSIQIAYKLRNEGLRVKLSDIILNGNFQYQAGLVQVTAKESSQVDLVGEFSLSPFQQLILESRFFQGVNSNQWYFNQSNLLDLAGWVSPEHIEIIWNKIITHHDALRLKFNKKNDQWYQEYRGTSAVNFILDFSDLTHLDEIECTVAIREKSVEIKKRYNIQEPPNTFLSFFQCKGGNKLLIAINHLVVDTVSWNVIIDDIDTLLGQLKDGSQLNLPPKTDSYKSWIEAHYTEQYQKHLKTKSAYWSSQMSSKNVAKYLTDRNYKGSSARLFFGKDATSRLNQLLSNYPFININTLFIHAFRKSLTTNSEIKFFLEGHGREENLNDINIESTIGWFTSLYPIQTDSIKDLDDFASIIEINARISRSASVASTNLWSNGEVMLDRSVIINYLGNSDFNLPNLSKSKYDHGPDRSSALIPCFDGEINIELQEDSLTFDFEINELVFGNNISSLTKNFHNQLISAINYLDDILTLKINQKVFEYGNYGLIDSIIKYYPSDSIQAIYPCNSLQKGLFSFHKINPDSFAYSEKYSISISGPFAEDILGIAFDKLLDKYPILKSNFIELEDGEIVQIIHESNKSRLHFIDISHLERAQAQSEIDRFEKVSDAVKFNLEKDALYNLTVIRQNSKVHHFVWTQHHIILDGWSNSILLKDFFDIYTLLTTRKVLDISQSNNFIKLYHQWLNNIDTTYAKQYWINYLSAAELSPITPKLLDTSASSAYDRREYISAIPSELLRKIREVSSNRSLSITSILQYGWSVLLAKYTNNLSVTFGTVISGRDIPVNGIEQAVGLFINTIPVVVNFNFDESHYNSTQAIMRHLSNEEEVNNLSFSEIISCSEFGVNLIDHVLVFENFPDFTDDITSILNRIDNTFNISETAIREFNQSNYNLSLAFLFRDLETVYLKFVYNENKINTEYIKQIEKHFNNALLRIVDNYESNISHVDILDKSEELEIISLSSGEKYDLYPDKTILDYFKQHVEEQPEKVALIVGNKTYTYLDLNAVSNQFGHYLIDNYNPRTNQLIPVKLDRTEWFFIAILAIHKIGAAYVPIEPGYPQSRIDFILSDTKSMFHIDDLEIESFNLQRSLYSKEEIVCEAGSDRLAYCIYTSGSTGNPKGVLIDHKMLLASNIARLHYYNRSSMQKGLLLYSFAFDSSVNLTFKMLVSGGTIVLYTDNEINLDKVISLINENQVDTITIPPGLHDIFLESGVCPSLRNIIVAGEECRPDLVSKHYQKYSDAILYNEYGPTECTVWSTVYRTSSVDYTKVPIGRPIANTVNFVIDRWGYLMPVGLKGELCIGGPSVGKGYLNNEQLNSEKFVWSDKYGIRYYKTGDICFWSNDSQLIFNGRRDNQIKIRGFRVELGEIESVVGGINGIQNVASIVKGEAADKQIVCFYVGEINEKQVMEEIRRRLPDYMVPSVVLKLDEMPLTPHLKVDVKGLLERLDGESESRDYLEFNLHEKHLADIWSMVLKKDVKKIAFNADFFALGGDSIKAIMLISQLRKFGLEIKISEIMENSVFSEMCKKLKVTTREINQSLVSGEYQLLPMQKLFLSNDFIEGEPQDKNYFLLGNLFELNEAVKKEHLEIAFQKLFEHHDSLRARTVLATNGISQYFENKNTNLFYIHEFDFSTIEINSAEKIVSEKIEGLNKKIDIFNGPVSVLANFSLKDCNLLYFSIHHLFTDLVSWRILSEDLNQLLEQIIKGQKIELPAKTDSSVYWNRQILQLTEHDFFDRSIEYWKKIEETTTDRLNTTSSEVLLSGSDHINIVFTEEETSLIKAHFGRSRHFDIESILFYTVGRTFYEIFGLKNIKVNLEGHGRDNAAADFDISRTVGWFTSSYPVLLHFSSENELDALLNVQHQLENIPDNGISYGWLRQTGKISTAGETSNPLIDFNYHGEYDDTQNETSLLKINDTIHFNDDGKNLKRKADFILNAKIQTGVLKIDLAYFNQEKFENRKSDFVAFFKEKILGLIGTLEIEQLDNLISLKQKYPEISFERINHLIKVHGEIEDLYSLTPMQQGLLYLNASGVHKAAYFEQFEYLVNGFIDIEIYKKAFDVLFEKHDALRAIFDEDQSGKPIQIVKRKISPEFVFTTVDEHEFESKIHSVKEGEIQKGFRLENGPLLRMNVIHDGSHRYFVLWNSHHIILDGWSMAILFESFKESYHSLVTGLNVAVGVTPKFGDYVRHITPLCNQEAIAFWTNRLKGYENEIQLPGYKSDSAKSYQYSEEIIELSEELSEALQAMCSKYKVTLNNLMQVLWALILSKYNNISDVVFGSIVSGRNVAVNQVEDMVGLLINMIPIRISHQKDDTFTKLIGKVQAEYLESLNHHFSHISEIQNLTPLGNSLINHFTVFENYPENDPNRYSKVHAVDASSIIVSEQNNYDISLIFEPGHTLKIKVCYNENAFENWSIPNLRGHWNSVVRWVLDNPETTLDKLEIYTDYELNQLQNLLKSLHVGYPQNNTILSIFEGVCQRHAERIALVFENVEISYEELSLRTNKLAAYLQKFHNVRKGDFVTILLPRGEWAIISIISVIKCGAVYVPIDVNYPQERIEYIKADCNSGLTIDENIIREYLLKYDSIEPSISSPEILPDDSLYVIYTSGTTGKPKGSLISHRNVVRLFFNDGDLFNFDENDVWVLFHSYCFDFSVWEMFGALLYGGKLIIPAYETTRDVELFSDLLKTNAVTVLNQTPSAFYLLDDFLKETGYPSVSIRKVIFGGEALNPRRLENWHQRYPEIALINMYGITETTVHVTYKKLDSDDLSNGVSNIGTAIPTLASIILGENGELLPHGSIGEIHVVGSGLSKGYLNKPELTAEKFVFNKYLGLHTYKSGDLGRYINDHEIEYFGRIDNQVKVRGHRIELSEVESAALENLLVKNAQAIINKTFKSTGEIVLYFVGEATPEEVRLFLSERLPDFMLPAFIVNMEAIPLNNNGKVDRSKLPAPVLTIGNTVFKPESEAEIILSAVFEEVLKLPTGSLGEDTSFISMGGDSIKSIQVISKLRAKGFKIKVSDIMKMQSIKALAKKLEKHEQPAITEIVSEKFGLSPIQHFFFNDILISGEECDKHFYNQSYLFDLGEKYSVSFIEDCLYDFICHHDSLRIKFEKEGENYFARYQSPAASLFRLHETTIPVNLSESNREDFISEESEKVKKSLHFSDGPLLGALLLQDETKSTLLISCHHLLVDLVSWRIMIDDLNGIIKSKLRKATTHLPEKGSSYYQWVCALEKYATGQRAQKQIGFWNDVLAKTGDSISQQLTEGKTNLSDCVSFEFTVSDTGKLVQSLSHSNQIEINSVLLYALSMAASRVLGLKNIRFNLEGHGREEFDTDIHIDRTVGWFTSLFPFNIDAGELGNHPVNAAVELNSRLTTLPDKGFGFGVLWQNNYLNPFGFPDYNSIEFNYMGSFYSNSGDNQDSNAVKISPYNHGPESNAGIKSGSILSVGSMIFDNRFSMKIWYNSKQLPENIMNAYSAEVSDVLQRLVMELLNSPDVIKTANGFNYKDISPSSLMRLEEDYGPIEDVLHLTPLQRGIFFHTELNNDPEMYFVQFGFLLKDLKNTALFKEVIREVLSAYDILNVVFTRELDQLPLQIVLQKSQAVIEELDISYLTAEEQKRYLENYFIEQRKIAFNLLSGSLIRIKLLKVGADDYYFLWNNHHIILDGWSTQILLNDIYRIYSDNLLSGSKRIISKVDIKNNFRHYVDWLDNYNQDRAIEFWKKYLENYEPVLDPFSAENKHNILFETRDAELIFDSELTESVYSKAAQMGLTVSTLFQGLWAIIYSKYCVSNDVVFGIVTSGRPSGLENVENIVGALINTVPLRIKLNEQETLQDYLRGIENGYIQVEPHQYVGLSEIQNAAGFKTPIFSHAIVFENYPVPMDNNQKESTYRIDSEWNHVFEKNSYNLSLIVLPEKTLRVILKYNANVISESTIQYIKKSLLNLMHDVISDSFKKLNEIEILDLDSQLAIVDQCTQTTAEVYDDSKTLIDQYYEGNLNPSDTAVIFRGKSYSYSWLEKESNRFSSYLHHSLGINKGEMVAVQLPRSEYLPVVLIGILKNSCAYVPIAIDQPEARTKFMLEDCDSKVIITIEILNKFKEDKIIQPKVTDLPKGNDLIYCIYTSGSTGQPKGCLLEHHSLLNRLKWMQQAYSLGSDDVILQKTPYTFDVSVWEHFWWLMYGAKMCLLEQDAEKDPEAIVRAVEDNQVTVVHFVPSMFTVFLDYLESNPESIHRLKSLKQIFTSGEALLGHHVRRLRALLPDTKLMNLYGPTEASIDVSYYDCSDWDGFAEEIPIGKPIFNTGLLVLGSGNKILPPGSVGEIAISGVGLARGYLNKPELTRQKFIAHPTDTHQKVYLTGDLGRWNVKGQLEYLGRLDDQVKIRGNRIELGEITSKILGFEGVRESVVVATKIQLSSHLELVAYIVGTTDYAKLKRYLSDNLPSYMVPSHYVPMESIPLSSSGKVNRKLLPDPENTGLDVSEYVAPGTAMEIILAAVWASVLQKNLGKIGLASDFFDLGGDSIKAIQVVSKLRVKGFSLRLADVISNTTLEKQARHIQKASREISQNPETGVFALGPIQYLFLNNGFMYGKMDDKYHFNQSYIFDVPEWADQEMIAKAWDKIILHHDALRLRFSYRNDSWIQEYSTPGKHNYYIHTYDLTANHENNLSETILQISESVKKATHLQNGPLVNLGFFFCRDYNRLLVTIHHLAVDMVSWQIIKEDFGNLLLQLKENKSLELPLKTDSYKNWILAHHSADYKYIADKHRSFWEGLNMTGAKMLVPENTPKQPLSAWKDYKRLCSCVSQSQFIEISRKKKSSKADTLLLYALSKALNKTFGEGVYACYSETHGRSDNDVDLDVSRTVGWFTDMYPVLLNTGSKNENINEFLSFHDQVYQQMELNKSFLWNHYLHSVSDPRPDSIDFVEFNFLGEISNKGNNQVEYVTESTFNSGADASQNLTPKARIIIVSGFVNGNLQFDVSASETCFSSHTINQLLNELEAAAAEIINQLINSAQTLKSGVDFTYNQLPFDEIHSIEQAYGELEDVYGLSPMQKGLFYLGLYNENNQSYCVQFGEKYKGNLNVGFFKEAIIETVANNPSLKAIFRSDVGKDILQIIPKDAEVDFDYIDLSEEKQMNHAAYCLQYAAEERSRPFDFSKGKLLRTKLFKWNDNTYYFLWTNHHIILDGWSTSILLAEIKSRHDHKMAKMSYNQESKPLFSDYIKWLGQQKESQSIEFWKQKLSGYNHVAEVKSMENHTSNEAEFYTVDLVFNLSVELTRCLEEKAKRMKTTLNTITQAAYGLLLSYYSHNDDVVFGAIVSGRPAQIPDIQKMVGLFFNTIPLRVKFHDKGRLSELLGDIQKYFIESQDYHFLNVADFNKMGLSVRNPIRTLLTFENYPSELTNDGYYDVSEEDKFIFEQTNYDLSTIIIPGDALQFIIKYNPLKYDKSQIDEIQSMWELILEIIVRDEDALIQDFKAKMISLIVEKEKSEIERQKNRNLSKLKKFKK